MDDLVERDGIHYKKFSDVPFTGEIEGMWQGRIKNGVRNGPWLAYYDTGGLVYKGDYKNGEREGPWVSYWQNGQLFYKGEYKNDKREGRWVHYGENGDLSIDFSGVYKDGVKISD
jgi:antitoxin component YwqK of YwqJK toxin-antitoxin module